MTRYNIAEISCKSILNVSKMPFADYTLNAYLGCSFACSYCYVPVMRSRRGQIDTMKWGDWVQVKVNAVDVFRRQMLNTEGSKKISIGTAADSWQPVEKQYKIARGILKELTYYPNPVHVLTRSPLLMRDIDLLQRIENVRIGVSLPTFDDAIRKSFEPFAPSVAGRVELIKRLVSAGLTPTLFMCPVLTGVTDTKSAIESYLANAKRLGVERIIWSPLSYQTELASAHHLLVHQYWSGIELTDRPSEHLSTSKFREAIESHSCALDIQCH